MSVAPEEPPIEPAQPAMTTLLVVDDDPLVRRTVVRALERDGRRVLSATSGAEALSMLARDPSVQLLVSDVMMDDTEGPSLARQARGLRPDLLVIFMSGETPENLTVVGVDKQRDAFLAKPFRPEALLELVNTVLGDRG